MDEIQDAIRSMRISPDSLATVDEQIEQYVYFLHIYLNNDLYRTKWHNDLLNSLLENLLPIAAAARNRERLSNPEKMSRTIEDALVVVSLLRSASFPPQACDRIEAFLTNLASHYAQKACAV